ncbi:helix-turn-helix domain-containing protein [Fructilactobacillus hinvesii]|uniref:Helix-turn-helix domain-containing protein n=1 Tax=Fructilactobacillus hinvesii TaxID=2940300 RepID=A0ABY5BUS2_9LACO|nr:helix-turn-helix transcriptional regulator [Fructilactobacillus hinvesii]USS87499.1 helix-turn-helix domain-containing protein [Fructilactobacillus hinvesii]
MYIKRCYFSNDRREVIAITQTKKLNIKLLKEKRIEKGISQREMSKALGMYYTQYSRGENGERTFKANELPIISEKLGIPIEDLFS